VNSKKGDSALSTRINRDIFFIIAIVICAITNSCSSKRHTIVVIDKSIYNKIFLMNFEKSEDARLREASAVLFTPRCTEAFKAAGLRSPLEVVRRSGVVIQPSTDLYIYSARELGLVNEQTRRSYAREFGSCRAQAGTVNPIRNGTQLTIDGRPHIFIHETAFLGESFWFGSLSLPDVLVHEFIHVGGQPPTPGRFGMLQQDLAGFPPYDRIMTACQ
jgi:hypothetical protein